MDQLLANKLQNGLRLARATIRPDLSYFNDGRFLDARPRVGYFYSGKKPVQSVADSMIGMKVRDFQSIPVVVAENISVYDAICHMFLEDVGTFFVVSQFIFSYWSSFEKRFITDKPWQ